MAGKTKKSSAKSRKGSNGSNRSTRGAVKFGPKSKERFLRVLEQTGLVQRACDAASIVKSTAFEHRKSDPDFAEKWEAAVERYGDRCEEEAYRRAVEGWDEPVFHKGGQCGVVRKYSDRMLELMLKARRPERFREKAAAEVSMTGGVLVVGGQADSAEDWASKFGRGDGEE